MDMDDPVASISTREEQQQQLGLGQDEDDEHSSRSSTPVLQRRPLKKRVAVAQTARDDIDFATLDPELYGLRRSGRASHAPPQLPDYSTSTAASRKSSSKVRKGSSARNGSSSRKRHNSDDDDDAVDVRFKSN
jgi:hypothetical protein